MANNGYYQGKGGEPKEPVREAVLEIQSLFTCECGVVLNTARLPFTYDKYFTVHNGHGCLISTCECPACKRIIYSED